MAERTKKTFRGSVHGFKKKDVNAYILELSKRYSEIESEYREKVASLEAENERLSNQLAKAEARAEEAEARVTDAAAGKPVAEDAKKAAEALSEIKKIRSQLKKRVREFESKYGDVLPVPEKVKKEGDRPAAAPKISPIEEKPAAQKISPIDEKPAAPNGDFESYLKEFRSSTSALFQEFDRKYGTKISGGDGK